MAMLMRVRIELVGRVLVLVHPAENPSDADWDAVVAFGLKHFAQIQRVIVYSAGGAPSVQQRRKLNAITRGRNTPGALVTASRASRTIAVAITWFHREFRVFDPTELRAAFEFLRFDAEEAKAVLACIQRMARDLAVIAPEVGTSDHPLH